MKGGYFLILIFGLIAFASHASHASQLAENPQQLVQIRGARTNLEEIKKAPKRPIRITMLAQLLAQNPGIIFEFRGPINEAIAGDWQIVEKLKDLQKAPE